MRAHRAIAGLMACLVAGFMGSLASAAQAKWVYQDGPETGRHAAWVCADGAGAGKDGRLCFGLSCDAGQGIRFGLSAQGDAVLLARADLNVLIFVGARALAPLSFTTTGLGTFEAPLTAAHAGAIARLQAGSAMDLRYWETEDAPPLLWRLSLKGSRAALDALQGACPVPAPEAPSQVVERDPAARVLTDMRAACAALGGTVTVGEGYATAVDLAAPEVAASGARTVELADEQKDGLILRHERLICSAQDNLVCGPAGCLASVWKPGPTGYARVFLNAVQDIAMETPGALRLLLRGALCGSRRAGSCTQIWTLQDGRLAPE
ncbi:hypothetical protein [Sagittula salina]|uniref:Uncharacterized protein n=1 Tax=Sagittula salina TaxID=2820268 RepID=A0A940MQ65_9RHOB|nr:hypothetical protein [Sagittula salina]MBP0483823.1 hypothetical protein [Sagittula salina]